MIDMGFLLITFFVMTIRLGLAQDSDLELPHADQAQAMHERKVDIVTVSIDENGTLRWGGRGESSAALRENLESRLAGGADVKVVLRADARAPFSRVQDTMRTVAIAGVTKLSVSALRLGDDS